MLLDQTTLNRMSAETREHCRTNNLCFYCKEPGHGVDTCAKKALANARNTGRGSRGSFSNYRGRGSYQGRGQATPGQSLQQSQPAQYQHRNPDPRAYTNPQQYHTQQQHPPQRPQFSRPQFGRLRSLEQGFVEGEVSSNSASPTPFDSVSQTQTQQQQHYQPQYADHELYDNQSENL